MKGAFETAIVIFFGMMFLWMGISMVQVMWAYNQARYMQEYVVSKIERQNRYDNDVHALILADAPDCEHCVLQITPEETEPRRLKVSVMFPIRISVFGIDATGKTVATTRPIS